jgi:hypothetical protein
MAPSKVTNDGDDSRYTKKKKADRGVHLEPMKTVKFMKGMAEYEKSFLILDNFISFLKRMSHPRKWKTYLAGPHYLRVVQRTLSCMDEHPGLMLEKSRTHSLNTTPSMEISRSWEIHIHDRIWNEWIPMFEVKTSTLNNAGYGLFALRPFQVGDALGVFYGEVFEIEDGKIPFNTSEYAIEVNWPKETGRKILIDPKGGTSTSKTVYNHCYFGLHFANDPYYGMERSMRKTRGSNVPNAIIQYDLVGRATETIRIGDEIFLDYNRDGYGNKKG